MSKRKFKIGDVVRHDQHAYQNATVTSFTERRSHEANKPNTLAYWVKLDSGREVFALEDQLTLVEVGSDPGTPEPSLDYFAQIVHKVNRKWWMDLATGEPIQRNVGEMLMLAVSELAEALEANRKDLMDDHLPHRKGFEVEIVDCLIRLFDISGGLGLDLDGIFREKMKYNANRPDHKAENRLGPNGKKY